MCIRDRLSDRLQFVTTRKGNNNLKSSLKETLLGLPQGASLSSTLFILMINDLPLHIKNSITIIFADDTQLVISGPPEAIQFIIQKLESDLTIVANWMLINNLKLNISKTNLMIVGAPQIMSKLTDIIVKINDTPIQ